MLVRLSRVVMQRQDKIFFSILRSALWGTPVEIPEGFSQWGSIMHLATEQALIGLFGDALLTNPQIRPCLSEKFVEKLQTIPLANVGSHTQLNHTLMLLVNTLREQGIEPVLLKGQGLSKYYPIPQLRQCGDIDIYVGVENYEKAYDAILPLVCEIDDKSKIWGWMHFDARIGSVYIEVHNRADYMQSRKKEKIYREYMLAGLSKDLSPLRFGDVEVMTPNDTFTAFYVFYHLWRHFKTSGVGLRQFCDWACFLHSHVGNLELEHLKEMLETLDLMKPWKVFGCYLVSEVGLPQDEFPFYDAKYLNKVAMVKEYVMTDGNFGSNIGSSRVRKHGYLKEKMISFNFHVRRVLRMFSIFPWHTLSRLSYMLISGVEQVAKDFCRLFKKD